MSSTGNRRILIAAGVGIAVGVILLVSLRTPQPAVPAVAEPDAAAEALRPSPPPPSPAPPAPEPDPVDVRAGELHLEQGRSTQVRAATLPDEGELTLSLPLPLISDRDAESLAFRVIDPSGGVFTGDARVAEGAARAGVPVGTFEATGRYIVELETTERTHFPLRRFAIELR